MANSALIEDLEKQFGENPRRVFARLANEYRKAGDLERAIDICRAQVPLQPTYISGYIVLGQALFENGQLDEARVTFETALGLDPENLIGLRQLGDIARASGDVERARAWYNRLLEVDPQNEEIVAQLSALEAPAEPAPNAVASEKTVSWSDIHPEGQRASDDVAARAEADTFAAGAVGAEVELRAPALSDAVAEHEPANIELNGEFLHSAETTPKRAPSDSAEVSAVGVESFAMGSEGVELPAVDGGPQLEQSQLAGLELSPTAEPPSPQTEVVGTRFSAAPELALGDVFQLDTNVGFEVEESSSAQALAVREVSAAAQASADQPSLFEAPPSAEVATQPEATTVRNETPQPTAFLETHGAEHVTAESLSRAFVTETMAELYHRQGFPEEALGIYRQLAAQRPDDAELQERVARLELQLQPAQSAHQEPRAGEPAEASVMLSAEATTSRERPSVTIRSLFEAVAARRAPAGYVSHKSMPESIEADAPSNATATGEPNGALGQLFERGSASPADDKAATALAGAFSAEFSASLSATPGEPTRAAYDEFSLDDIFGGESARAEQRRVSPNLSFDEFFAGENGAGDAEERSHQLQGQSDPQQAGTSDLELFHAWLEGLKK